MNVRNCRKCGHVFNYMLGPIICPACQGKLEEKFQEVKTYIRENPGVGIKEVSEECDVEVQQIRQWLREERLELAETAAIHLNCEGCGAPIRSGRFCKKCKAETTVGLQSILNENKKKAPEPVNNKKDKDKMRFL